MNYKEVSGAASEEEIAQYSTGINLVSSFVNSLQKQGLLPKRWTPQAETKTSLLAAVETPTFDIAPYEQLVSRLRITPEQFARRSRYMVIGGRNSSELEESIEGKSNVGNYARSMIRNHEFTTLSQPVLFFCSIK